LATLDMQVNCVPVHLMIGPCGDAGNGACMQAVSLRISLLLAASSCQAVVTAMVT
jgi:hypothetical protein